MQSTEKPMQPGNWQAHLALAWSCPRCGARTRSGSPCRSPAMPNGRCRMHGGKSTGPSPEGRKRLSAARMVHGKRCRAIVELRRLIADDRREVRNLLRLAEE